MLATIIRTMIQRGLWKASDLSARNPYSKGTYPIRCPGGRLVKGPPPGNYWRYSEEKLWELDKDGRIWWGEGKNQIPAIKRFLNEVKQGLVPETIWTYKEVGHTQDAKKTLLEIFPDELPDFRGVKPVDLVKRIVDLATDADAIILDSFAGSGTTAHAVLALNKEDGGSRRFILCQMPFETKEQEQRKENICERITSERVRRVIKGVPGARDEALRAGLGGTFSYFRLGRELEKQAILDGKDLPSYEALAGYVFWTATGEEFQPKKMKRKQWLIGESREYAVFLIYDDDLEKLKDLALTLDIAKSLPDLNGRTKLIFAPTSYLDAAMLDARRIKFCQLPFEIYQAAEEKR